ncbi:hypothetical protein C1646_766151 [Rhizophagus diaphanus]|nr:hypothetical protein C1646_766151 [Rhizophagus diaphanus] [Rhizophagus sp. MUCL 43196]
MDLDSNAYYKLCSSDPDHDDRYNKIIKAIYLLQPKYDNETPEIKANPIEYVRRKEILQSIDRRKFQIWQYKQYILQEEAEMKRFQLQLASQSLSYSEKDKLASISYDYNTRTIGYETYKQDKITIAENTMPSAPKFEPACIPPARQEMVSSISHQSSNSKIIQQTYRNYKKRPESLAKRIWEVVRNDGTSNEKKFLGTKNESSVQPGYICCGYEEPCYPVRNEWIFEKIAQLWVRLDSVTYILVKKLLYQQGYILVRGEYWLDMLKWPRDPEYYSIDRKNNILFFIRISEYKAYESKSSGLLKPICDSLLKYIYHNNGEDITVNFSDLDDNFNFAESNISVLPQKLSHNGEWKESDEKLADVTSRILDSLNDSWNNPAFSLPLGRSSYVSSSASADRKGEGQTERWPDIIFVMKHNGKKYELIYVESSRLFCTPQKEKDNEIKLWCETNDRMYWVHKSFGLNKGEFGIIGIQVVRQIMRLNVLIRDVENMHCYYHLYKAEILVQ